MDTAVMERSRRQDVSRDSLARVITALVVQPDLTRAEIGDRTGLTRSPVAAVLAALDERGYLEQHSHPTAGTERGMGRPPLRIRLSARAGHAVALEADEGSMGAALFDLDGQVSRRARRMIPDGAGPIELLELSVDMVETLLAGSGVDRDSVLGVGVARSEATDAGVFSGGDEWVGFSFPNALARSTGFPVSTEGAANLGALAEHRFGAGRGCDELLYVRLSRRIGVGLVIGGRLHRGATGIAGELGHISLTSGGPICHCGNRGCIQARAGGEAILADVHHMLDAHDIGAVVRAAAAGDRPARRALADAGAVVGEALAVAVGLLNPGRIVVGGELAAAGEFVTEPLADAINRRAFPAAAAAVRLVEGELDPGIAGLLGGATLHLSELAPSLIRRYGL